MGSCPCIVGQLVAVSFVIVGLSNDAVRVYKLYYVNMSIVKMEIGT